jgi:hypothetical protein
MSSNERPVEFPVEMILKVPIYFVSFRFLQLIKAFVPFLQSEWFIH